MANKIQIKRGLESNINKSNLLQGELAVTTDSNKLYVGTSKGPIQLNKDDESLVIIDYYETDESKKEKIKSLFLKEDGSISEHQLVKPSILLAPTIEPTDQTSIYTIGQYVCGFGDTESKIIEPTGKQITKYTLIFTSMAIDGGIYLTYNVSGDTLTYTWVKSPVIQSDYNQNDSTASDYIKNRPFYEEIKELFNQSVTFTQSEKSSVYLLEATISNSTIDYVSLDEKSTIDLTIGDITYNLTHYSQFSGGKLYSTIDSDLIYVPSRDLPVFFGITQQGEIMISAYVTESQSNLTLNVKIDQYTLYKIDKKFTESYCSQEDIVLIDNQTVTFSEDTGIPSDALPSGINYSVYAELSIPAAKGTEHPVYHLIFDNKLYELRWAVTDGYMKYVYSYFDPSRSDSVYIALKNGMLLIGTRQELTSKEIKIKLSASYFTALPYDLSAKIIDPNNYQTIDEFWRNTPGNNLEHPYITFIDDRLYLVLGGIKNHQPR